MTRSLHHIAFILGLAAIAWVAAGYLPGNPLALTLLLPIAVAYLAGALELHRFRQATAGLAAALDATPEPPSALGPWLAALPPSLRNAVRLRVQGERVALPGPALTPYLTGLLVLLGMLGTFLGMVATLKGTGLALENATDVEAIRASLAAPVKGLGLAFGSSVAGVAASALLGLMSALARRDRQRVVQQLDAVIAGPLHAFSRAHLNDVQREEVLHLQRLQAEALPALVTQLQALVTQMAQQGQALQDGLLTGQQTLQDRLVASQQGLHEGLTAAQQQFHAEARRTYTGLAESVDRSLKATLSDSVRLAGAAIEPAVQATLAGLARESATLRDTLAGAVQLQLDGISARLEHSTTTLAGRWQAALAEQQRHQQATAQTLAAGFEQQAAALLRSVEQSQATLLADVHDTQAKLLHSVAESHATLDATAAAQEQARQSAFTQGLAALTTTLQQQGQQHADALAERQQQICSTLERTAQAITAQAEQQARATLGQITQLVQTASEAPRAAAQVIGELRQALSDSLVRDNAALDERNRLLGTLGGLLDAVNHASTEQRAAIDALVRSTTDVLDRVGARFEHHVDAGAQTLQAVAAQVTGSAAEVASLGEGFGVAVQLFSQASEQLTAQLQRIEGALGQSMARSDEQLAYYVAQAREIIDLTLGSQKQIVDDLQRIARVPPVPEAQAA